MTHIEDPAHDLLHGVCGALLHILDLDGEDMPRGRLDDVAGAKVALELASRRVCASDGNDVEVVSLFQLHSTTSQLRLAEARINEFKAVYVLLSISQQHSSTPSWLSPHIALLALCVTVLASTPPRHAPPRCASSLRSRPSL